MKDRTREATFNLVGGDLSDFIAIDLFSGSGVLAMESISRGAQEAIAVELDARKARDIQTNAAAIDPKMPLQVIHSDVFFWGKGLERRPEEVVPWCVFICPPYSLWETNLEQLEKLIADVCLASPPGSYLAVELCVDYPTPSLPLDWDWDLRRYVPAIMAIGERKKSDS